MWKNIVEPDSPQGTIRRMLIACWIPKATNTISEFVTRIVFTVITSARKHLNVTLYTARFLLL